MAEMASRPLSSLALSGIPPPSRTGTSGGKVTASGNRLRTGTASARTATSGKNAADLLAQSLVLRMRTYFKDVANDVKGQEIISQEVIGFMNRFKDRNVKEEDVVILQERIRLKLQGANDDRNSMASAKRELVANDDWARIYQFQAATGIVDESNERNLIREKQRIFKETLTRQVGERQAKIREERDEDYEYFLQEQDALKRWEREEAEKRRLQQEIIDKLRVDRQKQLTERVARKEIFLETKRQEEERAAALLAYETKVEFEKELEARAKAKLASKEFILQNETNKSLRAERKVREAEEDARYRREWSEQLDKQERTRNELVERTRRIQNAQSERAKALPESKTWMDPALIERYYKEKEAQKDLEEQRKVERVKNEAQATTKYLDFQRELSKKAQEQQKEEEARHAETVRQKVVEGEKAEANRRAAERDKKDRFRKDLEVQMQINAYNRLRAPMTEVEKGFNKKLLGSVSNWGQKGDIDADYLRTSQAMDKLTKLAERDRRIMSIAAASGVGVDSNRGKIVPVAGRGGKEGEEGRGR